MGDFLYDRALYVYDFWNGVYLWLQDLMVTGRLPFVDPVDLITGPDWKMWAFFGVCVLLYIAFCLLMVKLAKIPLRMLDQHMRSYGASINLNMPLYIIAIVLILFDEKTVGAPGRTSDGVFSVGALTLVAGLLLLVAVARMIRRAGLRFIYFVPLQFASFALLYLYILLWAPAALILVVLLITGRAMSMPDRYRHVCPYCGGIYSPGVSCACGRSTGAYDGYRYSKEN